MMRDGETGEPLHRDVRPMNVTYRGQSVTIDMPGWYPDGDGDGTFAREDMQVYNDALSALKSASKFGEEDC